MSVVPGADAVTEKATNADLRGPAFLGVLSWSEGSLPCAPSRGRGSGVVMVMMEDGQEHAGREDRQRVHRRQGLKVDPDALRTAGKIAE